MAVRTPPFYRAGHLDLVPVQQQLFGHGGFTRIRVRDDSEGSSAIDFFKKITVCHTEIRWTRDAARTVIPARVNTLRIIATRTRQ